MLRYDELSFPEQVEEPERECQVEGHEIAEADEDRPEVDAFPAVRIPRRELVDVGAQIEVERHKRHRREEAVEGRQQFEHCHQAEPYPHNLASGKPVARLRDLQRDNSDRE